ncbi:MAG: PfkB family carbohydrate kinase [Candidatus Omnitrophota bacterium]
MKLLIVGTIAFDTIETPFGKNINALGGSATYAALSASYFTDVKIISIIGNDFPEKHIRLFKAKDIDVSGIQIKTGKTFRWEGSYLKDLNSAQTIATHLNLLAEFDPKLTIDDKKSAFCLLANNDPDLQLRIIKELISPKMIAADTIEFWIRHKRGKLLEVMRQVDMLIINDSEAKLLAKEKNLIEAAKRLTAMGAKGLIIKKGEHGLLLAHKNSLTLCSAYPVQRVCDPTGAGDSFAGGFLGFLASQKRLDAKAFKKALIYGTIMASYNVEGFDIKVLSKLNKRLIEKRCREFRRLIWV